MYKQQNQYVLIPETTLPVIKEKLAQLNYGVTKGKLYSKNVLLIFGFILQQISKTKEENLDRGHLGIHSEILKKQYNSHSKCTDLLVKNKLLHRLNYSNQGKKCNRYALHNDYLHDNLILVDILAPNSTLKTNYNFICDENTSKKHKHLIENFKDLSIKYTDAKNFTDNLYKQGEISKRQYLSYNYSINAIENRYFYFRTPDTDKRFHTNLTNLPKKLRKFLRYKGETLVNIDVNNSQPFFLAVIINIILNKDQETLDRLKSILKRVKSKKASKYTNYHKIISELFTMEFDCSELNRYINSTCKGLFYELLATNSESFFEYENGRLKKMKKTKKHIYEKVTYYYNSKREYAKNTAMQVFFGAANNNSDDAKIIKTVFPALWKLTAKLKGNESSNFAALLQNLEAHLILDKITKEANKQFNAPLFTIHDSIATTHEHVDDIKHLILQVLLETVKLTPKVDIENWC